MTAQFSEKLRYDGIEMPLYSLPLKSSPQFQEFAPKIECTSTALWRGYIGEWEIVGYDLYLIGIKGVTTEGKSIRLSDIFPNCGDRVLADWYTGKLRVPIGECIDYVHGDFLSVFEEDLFIDIKNGVVENSFTVSNIAKKE